MKIRFPSGWAIVLAIILPACSKPKASPPIRWEQYTSPKDHFSLLVPGKPIEEDTDDSSPYQLHHFLFQVNEINSSYVVSYGNTPIDKQSLNQLYDKERDKIVDQYGRLIQEKAVTISGCPGRELNLITGDGKGYLVTRFFVSQGRFYRMLVIVPRAEQSATNILPFLNSFKLLDAK